MRRQFGIKNGYHMAYLFMIGLFMGILLEIGRAHV